jgi:hypothetical protein
MIDKIEILLSGSSTPLPKCHTNDHLDKIQRHTELNSPQNCHEHTITIGSQSDVCLEEDKGDAGESRGNFHYSLYN